MICILNLSDIDFDNQIQKEINQFCADDIYTEHKCVGCGDTIYISDEESKICVHCGEVLNNE